MIGIDLSETAQKSTLEVWDKIQSEKFFSNKIIFPIKKILRFYLRLNFVSDWISSRITYFVA